ncbi:hypothetical protein JCM19037_4146 [Geomicrobium sp. JCM 19037]|nr:hypothetical protein JCM19037_4146 [Geomicrobium sp. JCM 19037]
MKKELTIDRYRQHKEDDGMPDHKIMKEYGLNQPELTNWKRKNGLKGMSNYSVSSKKPSLQETAEILAAEEPKADVEFKSDEDPPNHDLLEEYQKAIVALKEELDQLRAQRTEDQSTIES